MATETEESPLAELVTPRENKSLTKTPRTHIHESWDKEESDGDDAPSADDFNMEDQAKSLMSNAGTLSKLDKFNEAIVQLNEAAKIYTKLHGRTHRTVAKCSNAMGNCLQDMERYDEALAKYEEALSICKELTGEVSIDVASIYQNMSRALFKLERFQEALDMNVESMKIKSQIPIQSTLVVSDKPTKKFNKKKSEMKSESGCGCM